MRKSTKKWFSAVLLGLALTCMGARAAEDVALTEAGQKLEARYTERMTTLKSHPVGQKKPNPWGLYDICGNVCERVSDTYAKGYYANSPKEDPTGPKQGVKSRMEYKVTVPRAGKYALNAEVVTANDDQTLNVSANDSTSQIAMVMPLTVAEWKECQPVTVALKEGANTLRFTRSNPPPYGVAIKSFTLQPLR